MEHYYHEFEKKTTPVVRAAELNDVERLVELELETFRDVYEVNPVDPDQIRAMIIARLQTVKELMIVGEIDGVIEGVMACQRTEHEAGDIKSWEETTNNGTLEGTHVPTGRNFYIVNLAVTEKGSNQDLSDQLIAMMLGRFIEVQGNEAHLLSRIPQFSQWLAEQGIDLDSLSPHAQDELARTYVGTTKIVDGKERLYDGVLQRYIDAGAEPVMVLRDSYNDPRSHNYEVLCVFTNPLPEALRRNRLVALLAGKAVQFAANRPALLNMLP